MCKLYFRLIAAGAFFLFSVSVAYPKLALSALFIIGGKLPQPIEVTDPSVLRASNPWFGTFIPQWNRAPKEQGASPPETAPRYEISFYATPSPKEPPHIVYVAYYAFDPATHRGFLYLPGSHEQWNSTNGASILRPRQDGRWNLADPGWCDQINAIIARSQPGPM